MTSNEGGGDRILGSLRSADGKGVVHMEDRFETDIDDLWRALTDPERLARSLGGRGQLASHHSNTARLEAIKPELSRHSRTPAQPRGRLHLQRPSLSQSAPPARR